MFHALLKEIHVELVPISTADGTGYSAVYANGILTVRLASPDYL